MKLALYFPRPDLSRYKSKARRIRQILEVPAVELIDADTGEVLGTPESVDVQWSETFSRAHLSFPVIERAEKTMILANSELQDYSFMGGLSA